MRTAEVPGIDGLLGRAAAAAEALTGLLGDERRALEADDLPALQAATAAKQAGLEQLAAVDAERKNLLDEQGLADDRAGMSALLGRAGGGQALDAAWNHYLELAARCQHANQVNGAIIRLRQQQISSVLATLTGDRPQTYGPAGQAARPSRTLAQA